MLHCILKFYALHNVNLCTIQENELVVKDALRNYENEYEIIDALPEWERRGDPSFTKGLIIPNTTLLYKQTVFLQH